MTMTMTCTMVACATASRILRW